MIKPPLSSRRCARITRSSGRRSPSSLFVAVVARLRQAPQCEAVQCAERLYADLHSKGVRCWFAPEDMETGDKILDRIDREIRVYHKLLLIFSEHSTGSD
jgi:hypothetical protein